MTAAPTNEAKHNIREEILNNPNVVLDDPDVMQALAVASDLAIGNVIDIRSIAVKRLENRLDNLEDTHKSVIAAAYENITSTTCALK